MVLGSYLDTGSSDLPAMIALTPLGGDARFWSDAAAALSGRLRTVAPDLPGCGQAALPDRPMTPSDIAQEVEALRRHLGLDKVVMAGCAVGGLAAANYAARYPQHTAALILANPAIRITPAASDNLRQRAALVRANGMEALLPTVLDAAFSDTAKTEERLRFEGWFLSQPAEGYALAALGACEADIAPVLPELGCPVLLLPGENDRLLPMWHVDEIKTLVPKAEVELIHGGAHFTPYQTPQVIAAAVLGFLGRRGVL